ncbi:hypothetical protein V6N13_088316 [Hibiscus sabdariffa]|uniref:Uncharacterized protein n=1 Tax=Hibiscus sabdariffa TaxID=183260 RepID=A0ABR2FZ57_9ROSI
MGSISKSFLVLAVLAAVVLVLSSEVEARALAETTTEKKKGGVAIENVRAMQEFPPAYGRGLCPNGCCRFNSYGCQMCC